MANVTPTSDTTSLASIANFLSSLGGNGTDDANLDAFANLLSQSQYALNGQATSSNTGRLTESQTATSSSNTHTTTTAQTPVPSLKNLASAWNYVLNKLQGQTKTKFVALTSHAPTMIVPTKKTSTTTSTATNTDTTSSVTTTAPTDQNAPSVAASAASNTSSTPNMIASSTTDASASADGISSSVNLKDPKTIAELFAELQILAQLIAKQLQNTSSGQGTAAATDSGTGSTATTDAASGATAPSGQGLTTDTGLMAALNAFSASLQGLVSNGTDASSSGAAAPADDSSGSTAVATGAPAAQTLNDLLSLAQLVSKQLDAAQSGDTTGTLTTGQTVGDTAQVGASFVPSSMNLTAKLQNMLVSLKSNAGASTQTSSFLDSSQDAGSLTQAATPNDRLLASADSPSLAALGSASLSKNTTSSPNGFLNVFTGAASPSASTGSASTSTFGFNAASTGAGITGNEGSNNGAFDLGQNSQGNNAFSASAHNVLDTNNFSSGLESSSSASSPYNFASQLALTKTTPLGTTGLPPAVEQVMLQLNRNVKSGNDQMTLQLNPAELGRVSIKLDIGSDGKVQGTVVANNPATLDLLHKDVRSLERALQDAGLRADPGSLQFSLGGQSGNSSGQLAKDSSLPSDKSTTQNIVADTAVPASDSTETYYVTPGRVNLRV